jgi:hypothetical protein
VESPSEFLEWVERRAKQLMWAGLLATVAGVLVLILIPANHPSPRRDPRVIFIGVTLIGGPFFALIMPRWLSLIRQARRVITEPPSDVFLTARFRRTLYGGAKDGAWLFADADSNLPIAGFSLGMTPWSRPYRLTVARTPAKIYGMPTHRALVVVASAEGMLVGRIGRTEYRDVESMSPLGRFLWKERHLLRR